MTKPIFLTDLQLILLSTASARNDGSLLPIPDSIAGDQTRIDKAIASLLKHCFVEERVVTDRRNYWRETDDERIGIFITPSGFVHIAPEADRSDEEKKNTSEDVHASVNNTGRSTSSAPTKIAQVLTLLRREGGASLGELVDATGWLPHTTRAALTGLRKKGQAIARAKRAGETIYVLAGTN